MNVNVHVTASFVDDLSRPATERTLVRFEIGFATGDHWSSTVGRPIYDVGTTNGTAAATTNWLASSTNVGEGSYSITVRPTRGWQLLNASVGIAIMMETLDSFNLSDTERNFPFLGSSAEPYGGSPHHGPHIQFFG